MVSSTFKNLALAKQTRIQQALLHEFSTVPLAKAQVAHIIKTANISRGAFYKYFTDLEDSYRYIHGLGLQAIHSFTNRIDMTGDFDPSIYLEMVTRFVDQVADSEYFNLVKMHYEYNESLTDISIKDLSQKRKNLDALNWAAMNLSHETIKLVLFDPENQAFNLKRFKTALSLIEKGK